MWKPVVLAVCLLLADAQPMENPYGVKLCGREFIRSVIFTCGGSRWKRSQAIDPFNQNDPEESFGQKPAIETILHRNKDSTFTPAESMNSVFSRQTRSFISEDILEALRKADRKGRDLVLGLSTACCKWGCSKSEISSLC